MSLYSTFSLHLEYGNFCASAYELEGHNVCVLRIEGTAPCDASLTLFLPVSQWQLAEEIAAKLNGISKPLSSAA